MYSPLKITLKYLRYFFSASNGKGHGVHSPFVFDFIKNVLKGTSISFPKIEELRHSLLKDDRIIFVDDFGAGSVALNTKQRKVKHIARTSLKPVKFARLLNRMVMHYHPQTVLELGTSLGITTCYLANTPAKVYTIEGAKEIADIAQENFNRTGFRNITLVRGNFDDALQPVLDELKFPGLVFIDGNHRRDATIRYFQRLLKHANPRTIMVFDDIHWSREMECAWEEIKNDPAVSLTIDLFFIGIIFFRKEFKVKQHFCIRF